MFRKTPIALLVAALAATGCASVEEDVASETKDVAVRAPDVAASTLARELGLRVGTPTIGRVPLESPQGLQILLFPGTNVASVAGRQLELTEAASEGGGEVWVSSADAAVIRATWFAESSQVRNSVPSGRDGTRARIPAPPPTGRPAGPSSHGAFADNRPSSAELAAWSVPLKRRWQYLVIHHSATATGNASSIDRAHRDRGFDGLGYDFVIGNGTSSPDGVVEVGYRWRQQITGAHAKTAGNFMNEHGVGICLVGDFTRTRPTPAQMRSLDRLCTFLAQYCGISASNLRMHGDVKSTECPGKLFPRDFAVRVPAPPPRSAADAGSRTAPAAK